MVSKYGQSPSLAAGLNEILAGKTQIHGLNQQLSDFTNAAKLKETLSRAPEGTKAAQHDAEVRTAATQFEGMLMQEMMKSMWQSVPTNGIGSGGREEALFRDMLNEAVAKEMSEHQSIGIRDIIIKDINRLDKKKD